jgi:hypothetical protein
MAHLPSLTHTEPDETESIGAMVLQRAANFLFKINNFQKKTQLNISDRD